MATVTPASIPSAPRTSFNVGTRRSKLALAQTELVVEALKKAYPERQFNVIARDTAGDRDQTTAFKDFTTKNLWTQEFEESLVKGELDFIVHSLKDVPTLLPPKCALGGVMKREDPRDVLVMKQGLPYRSLDELPAGSVVGTSSIRRTAQLAQRYPHLKVESTRGNLGTRLAKLDAPDGRYTCLILAAAGLLRLGLGDRITQYLDSTNGKMLYAVGQGAIGIEIREDDNIVLEMLDKIGDKETLLATLAERSLLRTLEGGCSAPLGVESQWLPREGGAPKLRMRAIVVAVDGSRSAEAEVEGEVQDSRSAEAFGLEVAKELVAQGAGAILDEIKRSKITS